ncbi:MAG: thiazole biosynthesis adenylyltransferase ThiF [Phycisphaerales bacterium]|nr:MAG: thiazole biosynthesis adenylyltransferase ThiF [Phycisphaerales bacterium]
MSRDKVQPDRYHRQKLLPEFGESGQRAMRETTALLVGCGALGSVIADQLCRAGIGRLILADRDLVELTNLQRQVLFDEHDAAQALPKSIAAKKRLEQINREVEVEAHVLDVRAESIVSLLNGVDLLLDGLDNYETRYLLNDVAVAYGLPYVYGGAIGTTGMSMTILPRAAAGRHPAQRRITWDDATATPCLRCLFPEMPAPGSMPTCDTAGVLGAAVNVIASHQVVQAMKLMTGRFDRLDRSLYTVDVWANTTRRMSLPTPRADCPCCAQGQFDWLDRSPSLSGQTTTLCGRGAVQVMPAQTGVDAVDLPALADRLAAHGTFSMNEFLLRGRLAGETGEGGGMVEMTLFPDGRAIIHGVSDPQRARSIYSRYIGA